MKNVYYIFLFLVFLLGVCVRFDFYAYNRPLWHDECSLALSIINKNIFGYFGLLEHNQSAPPLFMAVTKLFSLLFGIKEYVLRLLPLLGGILSIPAFYYFSKLFIHNKGCLFLASLLFSINYRLIYYSQEFKQYSLDVFLFIISFIFLSKIDINELSHKKILTLGCILGLLSMFSIPISFLILGYLLFQSIIYKKNIFKKLAFFFTPIGIIWIFYLFSVILPQHAQKLILDGSFWDKGFISLSITQIIQLFKMNLSYFFYPNKFILCQLILLLIGVYYLIKNCKTKIHTFLLCTFGFIFLASIFRIYPLHERVCLYLIPINLILFFLPFNYVKHRLTYILSLVLLFAGFCNYNLTYLKNFQNEKLFMSYDARTAMQDLISNYKNSNSYIIVNAASDSEFNYYKKYFNFTPQNILYTQLPTYSKNIYFSALDSLPLNYDYWFYMAYDYSHSPVKSFLKKWSKKHTILYESDVNDTYLLHIKK